MVGRRRGSIGSQRAIGRGPHTPEGIDAVVVGLVDRVTRRMRTAHRVAGHAVSRQPLCVAAGGLVARSRPGPAAEAHGLAHEEGARLGVGGARDDGPHVAAGHAEHEVGRIDHAGRERAASVVAQVQASGGKATSLKLLREGKPLTVTITPELRKIEAEPHHQTVRFWSVPLHSSERPVLNLHSQPQGVLNLSGRPPVCLSDRRHPNLPVM